MGGGCGNEKLNGDEAIRTKKFGVMDFRSPPRTRGGVFHHGGAAEGR